MRTYGTLREFINMHNPALHQLIIHTSDSYVRCTSLKEIDYLLDNEMYAEPYLNVRGNWCVSVQD